MRALKLISVSSNLLLLLLIVPYAFQAKVSSYCGSRLKPQNWMRICDIVENCPAQNHHWRTLTTAERTAQRTSITEYSYCAYPNDADRNGKECRRTEVIRAEITKDNVGTRNGRNFGTSHRVYMDKCLGRAEGDEMGHLVAAALGGTNQLYNLIAQHKSVNANRGVRGHPQNYWYNNERAIGSFLRNDPNNRIYMEVRLQYATANSRRPDRINIKVEAYSGSQLVTNWQGVQWGNSFQIPNRGLSTRRNSI